MTTESPRKEERNDDEFFVGYLPMPPRLTRFTLAVAAGLVLTSAGLASAAFLQRSPGPTLGRPQWSASAVGLVVNDPYPMLVTEDEEGAIHHVLLAGGGKYGPSRRVAERDGDVVTLRGNLFHRDRRSLMEVGAGPSDGTLDSDVVDRLREVRRESMGEVRLRGQIVDSKCYYGRMRPGGGRAHRACAQYCILGGMVPVLVVNDERGVGMHYVLETDDGGRANGAVLEYVAEPVEVHGQLSRRGDLRILRLGSISRL